MIQIPSFEEPTGNAIYIHYVSTGPPSGVARFFLVQHTKTRKKYPLTTKYTK
jgi:hypothetical protein